LDQVYVLGSFEIFVKLDYIRMFNSLHAGYLPLYGFSFGGIIKLKLRINLDGNLKLSFLMLGQFDICICTRSQMSNYDIIFQFASNRRVIDGLG
jgi:methionine salvage enolase-phosphatase E1